MYDILQGVGTWECCRGGVCPCAARGGGVGQTVGDRGEAGLESGAGGGGALPRQHLGQGGGGRIDCGAGRGCRVGHTGGHVREGLGQSSGSTVGPSTGSSCGVCQAGLDRGQVSTEGADQGWQVGGSSVGAAGVSGGGEAALDGGHVCGEGGAGGAGAGGRQQFWHGARRAVIRRAN